MRTRTILLLMILALVAAWGTARAVLGAPGATNRYVVVDGDTLGFIPKDCLFAVFKLGCPEQRLRLLGVDAFESKQTCRDAMDKVWDCGKAATKRLRQLVARPDFSCQIDPTFVDRHSREFSVCFAGGRDVGATLVKEGLAFSYGPDTRYVPLENEAKAARRGAWAGRFVRPQYWRLGARLSPEAPADRMASVPAH